MADQVTVANLPEPGSKAYVAYKLWHDLQYALPDDGDWRERINRSLDLYATCIIAAGNARKTRFE